MKVGRQSQGLELEKARFEATESDVWQFGLRAAGPVRPSLLWSMVFWPCEGVLGPELCRM